MSTDPHNPFIARAARSVLMARFAVLVDADGRVLDAHVAARSGHEPENFLLDGALVEALRRFHFLPANAAGHPQRGWSTVECALHLGTGPQSEAPPRAQAAVHDRRS